MAAQANQYKTEQISVFLENRTGRLAEVTNTLTEAGLNIRALSLADTTDFGILRMIVCDTHKAQEILKQKGFTLGVTNVVAVSVNDKPGGLNSLLQLLDSKHVNVEYMYAFVSREKDAAIMIFRFDKADEAIAALLENNVEILSANDICLS